MVAEDDAVSRRVLEMTLSRSGYDVVSVGSGAEALRVLDGDSPPRVLLLDWMMPGVDGLDVCRHVRSVPRLRGVHIIMVTALGRTEDLVTALQAGANDYVTKPFDRRELQARVAVGVRLVELEAELAARIAELEAARTHVKQLQGLLPICSHCKRIRTDDRSWQRIEAYIQEHSDARFTHSLCSECLETHYPP
jgi:DNA-binding response OmpR family regulator